jgi:hypothetical protein
LEHSAQDTGGRSFCLEAAARNRRAAPGKNGSYVIVGEDACFARPSGVASA